MAMLWGPWEKAPPEAMIVGWVQPSTAHRIKNPIVPSALSLAQ